MKNNHAPLFFLVILIFSIYSFCQTARVRGMGNVGYALSDDESCLLFNPAGLGLINYRWNGGAVSYIPDVGGGFTRNFLSAAYQNDKLNMVGFSGYFYEIWDGMYQTSFGVGYRFLSNAIIENSLGLSMQYTLWNFNGKGGLQGANSVGGDLSGDIGYIIQFIKRVRIGLVIKEIPLYNDQNYLRYCLGIGYKDSFDGTTFRILDISTELGYVLRTFIDPNVNNRVFNNELITGFDLSFLKSFSARFGYYQTNGYFSLSFGTGISFFNHFDIDIFIYRDGSEERWYTPSGISFSFKRVLNWNKSDLKWMLK